MASCDSHMSFCCELVPLAEALIMGLGDLLWSGSHFPQIHNGTERIDSTVTTCCEVLTVTADGWCWRSPEWDSKFRACSYLLLFQYSVMHDLFCLSKQIIFISGVRQLSVWHPLRGYLEHVLARCDARAWINKCCHIHFVYYDLYSASSKQPSSQSLMRSTWWEWGRITLF